MNDKYSLPENVILENQRQIIELLRSTEKEGIESLIEHLQGPNSNFFIAPASSKYHLNVRGGLAQHVLNVRDCAIYLNEKFHLFSARSLDIVTLLHDTDKGENFYVEKYNKNQTRSATPYEKVDTLPLGHGEKTLIILQKYIELTDQEMMSIRWHMGPYDPSMRMYEAAIKAQFPEVFMLYFADHLATLFLDNIKPEESELSIINIGLSEKIDL